MLKQLTYSEISVYLPVHLSPKNAIRSFELCERGPSLFKLLEETEVVLLWELNDI